MRVLIADDDDQWQTKLAHALRMRYGNVECFFAHSPQEAVDKRKSIHALDVVIYDLSYGNGKAMAAIEKIHLFVPVPVFVLTSADDRETFQAAKEAGARGCFIKEGSGPADMISRLGDVIYASAGTENERQQIADSIWDQRVEQAHRGEDGWLKRHRSELSVIVAMIALALPQITSAINWAVNGAGDKARALAQIEQIEKDATSESKAWRNADSQFAAQLTSVAQMVASLDKKVDHNSMELDATRDSFSKMETTIREAKLELTNNQKRLEANQIKLLIKNGITPSRSEDYN